MGAGYPGAGQSSRDLRGELVECGVGLDHAPLFDVDRRRARPVAEAHKRRRDLPRRRVARGGGDLRPARVLKHHVRVPVRRPRDLKQHLRVPLRQRTEPRLDKLPAPVTKKHREFNIVRRWFAVMIVLSFILAWQVKGR
jgi:hypothetical protein